MKKKDKTDKMVKEEKPEKAKERVKKEKSKQYVMKKNTGMKVLRIILWLMLTFVFLRGIAAIFKPDKEEAVNQMISEFKENYNDFTSLNDEAMAFAQNFVREYLTYEIKGEEEYKNRLQPYVASGFFNSGAVNDFTATAEAVYVQAYRMEDYTDAQKDVYVLAKVAYTTRTLQEDQTYTTSTSTNQIVLKVPIYCEKGAYVVESLPLVVSDSVAIEKYAVSEYYGNSLPDAQAEAIKTSVENFLKAYFEQDASVINYYLASSADKDEFTGLDGRFTFAGIDSIKSYQGESGIICLVEFKIKDTQNNAKLLQKVNFSIQENGGKYYIKSMDTRTGNLNIK